MKNKSINFFGIIIACGIVLLSVGCTNQNKQNNTIHNNDNKEVVSPLESAINEDIMQKYITDFLTRGYSKHYIINYINCEFREKKIKGAKIEAIIFTTMNYNYMNFKQNPDTVPYIREAKEKAQKETNPKIKAIRQYEYETMAKEHGEPFNSYYGFKLTGNIVNGQIDEKSIRLFIEQDGPDGHSVIYTPAEKMLPMDAPQIINNLKEYNSPDGWSFKYPSSWDKIEKDFIQETATGKTIVFHSEVTNLEALENWIKSEKKRKLSAAEADNDLVEESTVKNKDGRYIFNYTIRSKMDGSEWLLKTTVIFDGKRRYEFRTTIPPVTSEEFKTITDSLKS